MRKAHRRLPNKGFMPEAMCLSSFGQVVLDREASATRRSRLLVLVAGSQPPASASLESSTACTSRRNIALDSN